MSKIKSGIFLVTVGIIAFWMLISSSGAVSMGELRTAGVKKGDMQKYLKMRGKVEYEKKATLFSQLPGVIEFSAKEGDEVKRGVKIATINPSSLIIALKKAEANYQAAMSNLAEVRTSVKFEQIKQAEEQVAHAKITLDSAGKYLEYKKDLFNKMLSLNKIGSISEQSERDTKIQFNLAESSYLEAQKRLKMAEYNLSLLKKGSSENIIKSAEFAAEQAKAAVDEIKNDIEKTIISSPFDGVILSKKIENRSYVTPGVLLFETGEPSSAYIKVEVLTDELSNIQPSGRAYITGDIINGDSFEAKVYYFAPKAFTKISALGVEQQKIEVRLEYDKQKHKFKPGYEFDVNILSSEKTKALYVPYKSVFDINGMNNIFILKNNYIKMEKIETGIENDDFIEITSGLSENDIVIIEPPNSIKSGMKIIN